MAHGGIHKTSLLIPSLNQKSIKQVPTRLIWRGGAVPMHVRSQASRYPSLALRVAKNNIGRFIKNTRTYVLNKEVYLNS